MFIKKGFEYVSWNDDHVRVVTVITAEDKTKTVIVANLKAPGGKSSIPFEHFCEKYTEKHDMEKVFNAAARPEKAQPRKTDPKYDRNGWKAANEPITGSTAGQL